MVAAVEAWFSGRLFGLWRADRSSRLVWPTRLNYHGFNSVIYSRFLNLLSLNHFVGFDEEMQDFFAVCVGNRMLAAFSTCLFVWLIITGLIIMCFVSVKTSGASDKNFRVEMTARSRLQRIYLHEQLLPFLIEGFSR